MNSSIVSIKDVSTQIRGVSYSPSDVSEVESKAHIPVLRANNITENGINLQNLVFIDSKCISKTQMLRPGDILIAASSGSKSIVGKAISIKGELNASFGAFCKVIRPNKNVDHDYLGFYFRSTQYRNIISHLSAGANINNLRNEDLNDLQIPLPPLSTQKRIAEILDTADALRRKDQELLRKYDELAQAIFIDMFGDPVRNEKGWEVKKIGDNMVFLTSGSRGWAKYYSKQGNLYLRINNVGYNELKLNDLCYVVPPSDSESKRICVQENDLLVSITADLGRTCVVPINFPKAFINQHLALIRFKKEINPHFVSQVLSTEYGKNQFKKLNKGGVKAGLNFEDIKSLEFINPPLSLQEKYRKKVSLLTQIKSMVNVQTSEDLFHSLLDKAFKSELIA